jgi:hypothetical protein
MQQIIAFIQAHQLAITTTGTAAVTWVTNVGFSRVVSALPAPTATSTSKYAFWFKFLNNLVGNASRANDTSVENSPNFQGALNRQTDLAGVAPMVAVPPDPKGSPDAPAPKP